MSRAWFLGALATISFCGVTAADAKAPARHAAPMARTVVIYEGVVDAKSAERLLNVVYQNTDKVIGLKLVVVPSRDNEERYNVALSDGQLIIATGDPFDAPQELVINGPTGTTTDMLTVDGFYLIKSGGMHTAGAVSVGAQPVNEASLRLNPNVRLVMRKF